MVLGALSLLGQSKTTPEKEAAMKADLAGQIDAMKKQAQVMVDSVFSFGELGFQEIETSKYLTGILEKEGFKIERGVAGIPTAWVASWGAGKPVISLGSDIDDIPQASQKPGVGWHEPLIEGAPGHGEGHNSGVPHEHRGRAGGEKSDGARTPSGHHPVMAGSGRRTRRHQGVLCARRHVQGCGRLPVRARGRQSGRLLGRVAQSRTDWSASSIMFKGESAHAAGSPWRGKSALDAVELMDVGWNFRREHLRLAQRSHYVITNGGDQPNVVPPTASVWYYFREADYDHIMDMWRIGDNMAKAATLMTDTTVTSRLLGSAWPGHFNRPIAEAMYENIKKVGLPQWSEDDQTMAKGLQKELKQPLRGLPTKVAELRPPRVETPSDGADGPGVGPTGGGSDDIGDVSWNVAHGDAALSREHSRTVPDTTGRTESPWPRRSRIKVWWPAPKCRP